MKEMHKVHCFDHEEFACAVSDVFDAIKDEDEYNDIAIIAKYEDARHIIKELLCIGYDLRNIRLHDCIAQRYDKEFIISLFHDEIWCEPMFQEIDYINDESAVVYVLDDCSSKILEHLDSDCIFEVSIGEEDEDCECDECCDCCQCDSDVPIETDGNMHGFNVSNSDEDGYRAFSFYSTDLDLVKEMAKIFK